MNSFCLVNFSFDVPGRGRVVLNGRIDARQIVGVVGASGCGKSTFIRALLGFVPASGQVLLGDIEISSHAPELRQMGWVPQGAPLFPQLTVSENLLFALKFRPTLATLSESLRLERAQKMMDRLGVGHLADCFPARISGGERSRVALARALLSEPKFLLLDEAFSSLDSDLRHDLYSVTKEWVNELGIGALVVTHQEEEMSQLCTRVVAFDASLELRL